MTTRNGSANAAPPTEPAVPPEETALQQSKKLAELKRDIAKLEQERRDAEKPTVDSQRLAGETTLDDKAGYLAEIVAYQALDDCAEAIAKLINRLDSLRENCKILLVDTLSFVRDDYQLSQINLQLEFFTSAFAAAEQSITSAAPPRAEAFSPTAAVVAVSAVAGLMADLVGYFRSDYSVKGREIQLGDEALKAAVAGRLARRVLLADFALAGESELVEKLREQYRRRFALQRASEGLAKKLSEQEQGVARLKAALESLATRLEQTPEAETARRETLKAAIAKSEQDMATQEAVVERIKAAQDDWAAVSKAFDSFLETTVTAGEGDKLPPLLTALLREQVRRQNVTHVLQVRVVSSGGETITRKNLFRSGQVSFLGGCAASYILADAEGTVVAADTRSAVARLDYNLGSGTPNIQRIPGLS